MAIILLIAIGVLEVIMVVITTLITTNPPITIAIGMLPTTTTAEIIEVATIIEVIKITARTAKIAAGVVTIIVEVETQV